MTTGEVISVGDQSEHRSPGHPGRMSMSAVWLAATFAVCGITISPLGVAQTAFAAASPTIVVTPDSAMVNTSVKLVGTGFPAGKKIVIEECSKTFWIVPQNPCATSNVVRVRANTNGGFTHKMKVQTCPVTSGTPGFSETCYVGEPAPEGIDTVNLSGSAKITVTGP